MAETRKKSTAKTTAITGPMFSGKSSYLQMMFKKLQLSNKNVLYGHSVKNTRDQNGTLLTHSGMSEPCIEIRDCAHLRELVTADKPDVVLLDESHFFDDLLEMQQFLQREDIDFVFAALNMTFKAKPWPSVMQVLPFCNKHKCMNAVCKSCGDKRALFSRLLTTEPADDSQPVIGGAERFESQCWRCFEK